MTNKFNLRFSLNKETIARMNDEQLKLVEGGLAAEGGSTVVVSVPLTIVAKDSLEGEGGCGRSSIVASRSCPSTSTCGCSCK